jgi:phospholipid/cholesterol/gamma-HCH transport system substrate-binding protein
MRLPFRNRSAGAEPRRIPRKDRRGASPVMVGLVLLVVTCIGLYLGFRKDIPFTRGYQVKAVFNSSNNLRPNSPVRIAGVDVGKVKKIERYQDTDMAVVTMEVNDKGRPIHKDATAKIRSRIFLEGNFFVDLSPGTPSTPALDDGETIQVTRTSSPVQLDEILTTLQEDTREDLKTLLAEYGNALSGDPRNSDDGQDPSVRGETAAESLNDTFDDAGPALRGVAIVNEAFLGEEERDLSRTIAGLQRVTAALGRNEAVLQDFVENFNATLAIFADEKENVSATIRGLAETLPTADRALASLNSSFPNTRAFAREILPGVRETPATIEAAFPWIEQTRRLLGPDELQGLARDLSPATRDLAVATDAAVRFFPQQNLFAKCLNETILPTGDIKIVDGSFTTGVENYKEFWYGLVGLAGESQNFDGNGQYVRFQPGGGTQTLSTGRSNGGTAPQAFNLASPPIGVRPVYPGKRPPYRPDAVCHEQTLPNLNSARTGPPDGGQGPAAGGPDSSAGGSGGGSGGGQPSGPSPALPQIPGTPGLVPSVPGLPTRAATARSASRKRSTVTSELVKRLNPFRTTRKQAKR